MSLSQDRERANELVDRALKATKSEAVQRPQRVQFLLFLVCLRFLVFFASQSLRGEEDIDIIALRITVALNGFHR